MPQKGYQALIGMLKWALPLDFKRTLQVMLEGLYTKIVMQKIKKAQTPATIRYRTRLSPQMPTDAYPFDNQTFKKSEDAESKSKDKETDQSQSKEKEGLIPYVLMTQTKSPGGKLTSKNTSLKVDTRV